MNVEGRLAELIGEPAGRLHTARSRNDQVATDFRLWVRDAIDVLDRAARDLQAALIDRAEEHAATVMPGFTHLQAAQPVTFGHHLLAYVEMLGRDRGRLTDCRARLNESPLGAAALAGTSFPIDRRATAAALGFDRRARTRWMPSPIATSRWSSCRPARSWLSTCRGWARRSSSGPRERFGFLRLADAFSTGSSIMPQKRNPDAAELTRAKAGRVVGRARRPVDRDEGAAARLRQGHAGGQGTGVRGIRHALALPRGDAGNDRDGDGRHASGCGRRPKTASPTPPTSLTGSCASRVAFPPGPSRHWRHRQGCRDTRLFVGGAAAGRDARDRARDRRMACSPCWASTLRSPVAPPRGAPLPLGCGRRRRKHDGGFSADGSSRLRSLPQPFRGKRFATSQRFPINLI